MGYTPPPLQVRTISGGWKIYPPTNTSGDDLEIYPNGTDTTAMILLQGAGNVKLKVASVSNNIILSGNADYAYFSENAGAVDCMLQTVGNRNIYLNPNGTGKVKFGTHTAQADTPVTGYIDMLDAGGNARKIAIINP